MTRGPGSFPSAPGGLHPPPALDMQAGVERLMGNRQLYQRALARFHKDYRHAGAAMRAAVGAGDIALAQRLAHTLKGAAGMIEAGALHAATLAFEQALRSGECVATPLVHLEAALSGVLDELDGMGPLTQELVQAAAPAVPDARGRLRAMLDIGDGDAVELATAARAELVAELGEREYAILREAVMEFDYERALEVLDRPRRAGE